MEQKIEMGNNGSLRIWVFHKEAIVSHASAKSVAVQFEAELTKNTSPLFNS